MNSVKVSVNILTKNRAQLLKQALFSIQKQTFKDYEIIVVNDGSVDETRQVLQGYKDANIQVIEHAESQGITKSRQEALEKSQGEFIAILDDDDEWKDIEKLAKQVKYLDEHKDYVLVGGAIDLNPKIKNQNVKFRPETDSNIRTTMLFRNNFFTSTVMFRKESGIRAGGFKIDENDFAEDYDLWLRMGTLGKMYNFSEVFTIYTKPNYNKDRFKAFLKKQVRLIKQHSGNYPGFWLAKILLNLRLLF